MSLALVISRVQALYEAEGEAWCDKDYVIGFLSTINEDMELWLEALGLSYEEEDIILPAVPAGTLDLSSYQANGNQLDDMMSPYSLEWKRVGDPVTCFAPVRRVNRAIDVNPNAPIVGISSYAWQKGIIHISPSSIATDIRVGCEDLPDVFQSDSDNYIKGTTNVLAYKTAELIGFSRGGGASKLGLKFQAMGASVMDSVQSIFILQEQLVHRRFGSRRGRGRGTQWQFPRE